MSLYLKSTWRVAAISSQAQQMVMDTLGLALCVGLTYSVRYNPRGRMLLPLIAFPVLSVIDLWCIFRELKATHLRTLNRERAEMVAERWLADRTVFTAAEVRPAQGKDVTEIYSSN